MHTHTLSQPEKITLSTAPTGAVLTADWLSIKTCSEETKSEQEGGRDRKEKIEKKKMMWSQKKRYAENQRAERRGKKHKIL